VDYDYFKVLHFNKKIPNGEKSIRRSPFTFMYRKQDAKSSVRSILAIK